MTTTFDEPPVRRREPFAARPRATRPAPQLRSAGPESAVRRGLGNDFLQRSAEPAVRRAPARGSRPGSGGGPEAEKEESRAPRAVDFASVTMEFDGADLIVRGDGKEVLRYSGQSGRPVRLSDEHAAACGANPATDSYMNDKRFVGIEDFGPLPEGRYTLSPPAVERFDFGEQVRMTVGGILGRERVSVRAGSVHAGDWGSGRVVLVPAGPRREGPCGNAGRRTGFFLHGGVLAGSSGCIDIGGDFGELADFLLGFRKRVPLTVEYRQPPPTVRFFSGLSATLAYTRASLEHGPSLALGAEFSPTGTRALTSVGYDAVLQWVGGALSAGVRLDVPFDEKGAFLRAALSGGADFRILGPLYGRLFGGYSRVLSGGPEGAPAAGAEAGAGLRLDLDRYQLEALFNVIHPLAADEQVRQGLVRIGFRF